MRIPLLSSKLIKSCFILINMQIQSKSVHLLLFLRKVNFRNHRRLYYFLYYTIYFSFLKTIQCFSVPPQIVAFDFGEDPINSGDVASVLCTVNKGDVPLTIKWSVNGKSIENFRGINIFQTNKRNSQLSIDYIQAEHAGSFICTATNDAGSTFHETLLRVNGTLFFSNSLTFLQLYQKSFRLLLEKNHPTWAIL